MEVRSCCSWVMLIYVGESERKKVDRNGVTTEGEGEVKEGKHSGGKCML